MLQAGVGQSSLPITERAAEEAAAQAMSRARISEADLVLVFFTVDHVPEYQKLVETLRRIARTDRIVGCSGVGVLTGEGEIEGRPGLAVLVLSLEDAAAHPFLFHPLRERDQEMGAEIARAATSRLG